MKKLFIFGIVLFVTMQLTAQAPDFDGYGTLGFNAGYAYGKVKGGATLGLVHGSVTYSIVMFEASASRLAFFNESGSKKLNASELLMCDIGFGHKITDYFYLGFSPFSINWTHSADYGLSVIAKAKLFDTLVLEGKLLPVSYTKTDVPVLKNNSYLGAHYWLTDMFAVGLRYNCYDDWNNYSIMLSWNLMDM